MRRTAARHFISLAVLVLLLLGFSVTASAGINRWTMNGYGGDMRAVAVSPNYASDDTVYSGEYGNYGVFKSTNGGSSWSFANTGIDNTCIWSLAVSPNYAFDQTVFAGSLCGGVFKTTSGGASWSAVNTGITNLNIYAFALSPNYANDQTVYVGSNGGVFKSTNGGASWSAVNTGITNVTVYGLAVSPSYASDQTVYAGTNGGGVFKSTNGGASWSAVNTGITNTSILSLAISSNYATDQTVYAGSSGGGVFKSTDGGTNWTAVNTGITNIYIYSLAMSPNYAVDSTVYVGTLGGGVFKSVDGGTNWTASNTGMSSMWIYSIAVSPNYAVDSTVYAGTDGGVWSYTFSPDVTPPASAVSFPTNGSSLSGVCYTITGTASDGDSGVQYVDVSTTGGTTWHRASGTTSWNYNWTFPGRGSYTIRSQATDMANNVESPSAGVTVTIVNVTPAFTGTPTITGNARAGNALGLTDAGTVDVDGDNVTVSYQWKANGTNIGTNAPTYAVTSADMGKTITCVLTANDGMGGIATATTAGAPVVSETTTSISSNSINCSSSFGSPVIFTASVKPSTATGSITFKDRATVLGTAALSGGTATLSTAALTLGTHTRITAEYGGDLDYAASTSLAITQTVTTATSWPLTFAAKVDYHVGSYPHSVAANDFNGDGKLDLAVANYGSNTVSVLLGNGNGTFASAVSYGTGTQPEFVVVGDFNGDGKPDLAVSNTGSYTISILPGNGNGTFASKLDYNAGTTIESLAAGDYNGDGRLDLATADPVQGAVSVILGNGNGTFTTRTDYSVGSSPDSIITADFNRDGKLDLAVTNSSSNNVSVLLGNGDGTFAARVNYGTGLTPAMLATGDFNNDGKLDLAVSNSNSALNAASVLFGNGNGTFMAKADSDTGGNSKSIVSGDFNGDGKMDFAAANYGLPNTNTVSVLLSNGNGYFSPKVLFSSGSYPVFVTAGDFNGDGKMDLVVANNSSNTVSVLLGSSLLSTAVTLSSGPNPASYGSPVAITAQVSPAAATGTVWFYDNGTVLGTAGLSGGMATFTSSSLAVGTHSNIRSTYAGDSVYASSSSPPISQTILDNTPPSSTTIAPVNGAALSGVTYTITGTASDTGSGVKYVDVSADGGGTWQRATGITSWSYIWNLPVDGSVTIKSRATDNANNVETEGAGVTVTVDNTPPASAVTAPADGAAISGVNCNISGTASDSGSGVRCVDVSTDGGSTWQRATGTANWSYDWTMPISGSVTLMSRATDITGNVESLGAGVTVTVSAYGSPELQHANWDPTFPGSGIWNTAVDKFLTSALGSLTYNQKQGFCLSCHNSSNVAHESRLQGKDHYMTLPVVNPDTVVCTTCHDPSSKGEDYGRTWELTTTGDRMTYTMQRGGWKAYGHLEPVVYRDTSLRAAPAFSRDRRQLVVDRSEYTYDENAGTVTFKEQQSASVYIYVTLDYPYLLRSTQDNKLCVSCHTEATHKGENCLTCHTAHDTDNVKDLRQSVRTPNRSTVSVKFLRYTGANSFADGDGKRNGICEVCHTTTKYYRSDGSGFANHSGGTNQDQKDCTACHSHTTGFAR